jgi:hypothetical protein
MVEGSGAVPYTGYSYSWLCLRKYAPYIKILFAVLPVISFSTLPRRFTNV